MNRRRFLKQAGAAAGLAAVPHLSGATQHVSIVVDPGDPIASADPSAWAVSEFRAALDTKGIASKLYERLEDAPAADRHIVVAGAGSAPARTVLNAAKAAMPTSAEAAYLVSGTVNRRTALLAGGSDTRGVVYSMLELADRVRYTDSVDAALDVRTATLEKPANQIRSCARCFVTPVEDKAWFYDREMWNAYLTNLATQRFNRFNLTFGIGYNSARDIPDSYFYLAYPFLSMANSNLG